MQKYPTECKVGSEDQRQRMKCKIGGFLLVGSVRSHLSWVFFLPKIPIRPMRPKRPKRPKRL